MFPPRKSFSDRHQQRQQSAGSSGGMQGQQQPQGLPHQQPQLTNVDSPIGDPIDQIAQMLGLDLTNATSPDQQGQIVVQAVESLVTKLHELSGIPDDGSEDQFPEDGYDTQEYEEGDEQDSNEQAPGQDSNEPSPPPKKKFGGGLSLSNKALNLAADGREAKINNLAQMGYVTPATARELKLEFCTKKAIGLALSLDSESDEFDKVCSFFQKNGPVIAFGEKSSAQSGLSRLDPEDGSMTDAEIMDPNKNPILANAVSRNKK